MSLYNRRTALLGLLSAASLAGCGLTPVYGPNGGAGVLRGRVALKSPTNENAFDLYGALERNLGVAEDPAYDLTTSLKLSNANVAISATNTVTRRDIIGQASYVLRDRATGQVAARGSVRSFTGYSNTGSTQATQTARDDANRRLMQILADQITAELIAALA